MRRFVTVCTITLALVALAASGTADEFDDLLARFEPPPRFAEHVPSFTVSKQQFTFQAKDGVWNWDFWVIKDHDRFVGVMPLTGFHGGTFYLITPDPSAAPTELAMPSERWHIDNAIGYAFRTDHFIPDKNGAKEWNFKDESAWEVTDDGRTLTLVRRFQGEHAFAKWEHNTQKKEVAVDHTGTFVLSCHPQVGYVFTGTWETGIEPGAPTGQYTSLMPPGLSNPWPEAGVCSRVAITPADSEGIEGWSLNGTCVDKAGGQDTIRDGGYGVYLDRDSGWSCAMTLQGGDTRLSICNVHADLDYIVRWPDSLEAGEDGLRHQNVQVRMVFFPPALTEHVWQSMRLRYLGEGDTVVIGLQETEDFEEQPLELDTTKRGITFGFSGHKWGSLIDTAHAYGGSKSLRCQGTVWPNIPQVVLEPGARYRLEAMVKVAGATPESLVELEARHAKNEADRRKRWEKTKRKNDKKGKDTPPFETREYVAPDQATAYIVGNLYRWTPHNPGDIAVRQRTTEATEGDDWQKVELEFVAPDWGPFIDIRFICAGGGTAWFDDFRLARIEDTGGEE